MSITKATPYLFFPGTAEQAIELYRTALGASVETLMRYGDVPGEPGPTSRENERRIIHAALRLGEAEVFLSDWPVNHPSTSGGNVEVCLEFTDIAAMTRSFAAL